MSERILIVDDDRQMAEGMAEVLRRKAFDIELARDANQALAKIRDEAFQLVITDLRMPGMDGLALLDELNRIRPQTRAMVVTAYATVESAVQCVRGGAVDYLMKPFSPDALVSAVCRCLQQHDRTSTESAAKVNPTLQERPIVAADPRTQETLELARRAAATDATVLLEAESGAGKEVFARYIHAQSPRSAGAFVAVNCAALPRELLEAELFGHARGAFTGAHRDRKGFFRMADGGTLLLDEIGEMEPDLQARLLRVLQDRCVQPIGGSDPISVDVRVIAATHRNLRDDVISGRFRQDLYYRLRVLPIGIPPLRERVLDIEPLAKAALARFSAPGTRLTDAAIKKLETHSWPGNVRELENTLQRAAILAGGTTLDADRILLEPPPFFSADAAAPGNLSLEEAEREAIRGTLARTGGNRARAAEQLGISQRTLRHKLKRYRDEGRPLAEAS